MGRTVATRRLLACAGVMLVALFGACTDAGLCVRGDEGCACTMPSNGCDPGLTCRDSTCVGRQSSDAGQDAGSDAGRPDAGSDAGRPDAGPSATCSGDTRMAACQSFCEVFCQNQERFCVASQCPSGSCEPGGAVLDACLMTCDDAACALGVCSNEAARRCERFGFDDMGVFMAGCLDDDPVCVLQGGCSDTCGSNAVGSGGDYALDDTCDDGSGGGAQLCPRGTDCTDCEASPTCRAPGESCDDNPVCCGYFSDEPNAGAFCVDLPSGPECLMACTRTGECPEGFECFATSDDVTSVCAEP